MHPKRILINSYQNRHPDTFYKNLLSIRLTELYEALFIGTNAMKTPYPHFQAYKFWFISYLIDLGMVDLAMKYLEHLSNFVKCFEPNNPAISPRLRRELQEFTDRIIVCCSVTMNKKQQDTGGWFGKLSNNLSGAAIGRGIEHLMNSAVGVEENSNVSGGPKRKTLYPMPGENVDYVASPSVSMAKMNSIGRGSDAPPSNSSNYAHSDSGRSNAVNSNHYIQYQPGPPFHEMSASSYPVAKSQDSLQTFSTPNLSPNMKTDQRHPTSIPFQPPPPISANPTSSFVGTGIVPGTPNPMPVTMPIPHPPTSQPMPQSAPAPAEEEDLGFGNSSFRKPPPVEAQQQASAAVDQSQPKAEKKEEEKGMLYLIKKQKQNLNQVCFQVSVLSLESLERKMTGNPNQPKLIYPLEAHSIMILKRKNGSTKMLALQRKRKTPWHLHQSLFLLRLLQLRIQLRIQLPPSLPRLVRCPLVMLPQPLQ
jgi:hypothetical protein